MAKLKKGRVKIHICETCHGNGYVRVAKLDGDPSVDFRDRSEVHQCWDCDSEGEYYETVESNTFGENVEEIGSNVLSILYWIWAFALLGGIGLNLRRGGPISDLGIESAVDAMLELGP